METPRCRICAEVSATHLAALSAQIAVGAGWRPVLAQVKAWGYGIGEDQAKRHTAHVKASNVAVLTAKESVVMLPVDLEDSVAGFADRYAARASVQGNAEFFDRHGVPIPPGGFKGATVQTVRQVDVLDEEGNPTGKKTNAFSWVRVAADAGEPLPEVEFDSLRKKIVSYMPDQTKYKPPTLEEVTYGIAPSDLQGGKPGTEEAVTNMLGGIRRHRQEVDHLKDRGYNIKKIVRWNGGDICEAFSSTFANQHYNAELDLRQQIDLAVDVQLAALQMIRNPGEWTVDDLYVPSNHGEWTRNGGKASTTSGSDNIDLHVGDMLRRMVALGGMDDVEVETAERHFIAREYSGTLVYLSHGYEEKGSGPHEQKVMSAIQRQILGNLDELHKLRIALMGHYHHDYRIEQSGWTGIGLAASEAEWSSEYLRKAYGVWSRPGVTGLLIGEGLGGRQYAHHQVL